MLGLRGVPATYGGVERHVEELGAELVARGHEVTVFCRTNYVARNPAGAATYRGMRLRHLPTVGTKHLDAIAHTALATLRSLAGFDVVHYHALGPGLLTPIPAALSRARVVQTVHGLDAGRAKWGPAARSVLHAGEWLSARVPDATITVSRSLAEHYWRRHGRRTRSIPNGVRAPAARRAEEIARRWGLARDGYVLFVGRLVPEKAPHLLVQAFRRLAAPHLRLVVAGGSSYTDDYVARLHRLAAGDDRVIFTGYLYGPVLEELYSNAALFVSPSALEAGPPLTLLEAAAAGSPVLVSDIAPQLELGEPWEPGDGSAGSIERPGFPTFPTGDGDALLAGLEAACADIGAARAGARSLARRVVDTRRWEVVAERTEAVYRRG